MKHTSKNKLASVLLSCTMLAAGTAGCLPGSFFQSLADSVSITASAGDEWASTTYSNTYSGTTFYFKICNDSSRKTASIISVKQKNKTLQIPETVYVGSQKYTVENIGQIGYSELKELYIPSTVTSLHYMAFYYSSSLEKVYFTKNGRVDNGNCNIQCLSRDSFSEESPFVTQQLQVNIPNSNLHFAKVGHCLLLCTGAWNTEVIDLHENTNFNNTKVIAKYAFSDFYRLKTVYLPKSFTSASENVFISSNNTLANVWFCDNGNHFSNLATEINNNHFSDAGKKILGSGLIEEYSLLGNKVQTLVIKKAIENAFQGTNFTYKGAPYSGYDAWTQYQIVHKLYTYIGKNYAHYNNKSKNLPYGESYSFLHEMIQVEIQGLIADNEEKTNLTRGIKCADYAKMFTLLCNNAGVNAVEVHTIPEEEHAFNVVKIGPQWFNIDSCAGWLGGTKTFLTPNDTIKSISSHTKSAEYSQYECERSIGDVNMDGTVDRADAQIILNACNALNAHKTPQFPEVTKSRDINYLKVLCDVDRSGTIDMRDAQLVDQYATAITARKRDRQGNLYTSFEHYYCETGPKNNGDPDARFYQFLPD